MAVAGRTLPNPPDAQFGWMSRLAHNALLLRIESDFDRFHRLMRGRLPSPLSNRTLRGLYQRGCPPFALMDFTLPSGLDHNLQLHTALDAHSLGKTRVLGLHFPYDHPRILGDLLPTQISTG